MAVDSAGKVLARTVVGGLNWFNIGYDRARRNLREAVDRLLAETGAEGYSRIAVGTAGLDEPATEIQIREFCGGEFDPSELTLVSDATAALAGFAHRGPAALVICGTGSAAILRDAKGVEHPIAGWGHVIGDYGGSTMLAREGLRAAMDARDGCGPATRLDGLDLAFFGVSSARGLAEKVHGLPVDELAAFAREVLASAEAGDEVAAGIVRRQLTRLAKTVAAALSDFPEVRRLALHGGVFRHSAFAREEFTESINRLAPSVAVSMLNVPPEIGVLNI